MPVSQYLLIALILIISILGVLFLGILMLWGFCALWLSVNEDYILRYIRNRKYGNVDKFLDFILKFYYNFV